MASEPRYRLVARLADGEERTFTVGPEPVVIGRDPQCDVTLPDPSVSRRHCECRFAPDGIALKDLGSSNGTFIREVRIEAARARPGEPVRFGRVAARFEPLVEEVPAGLAELELTVGGEEEEDGPAAGEGPAKWGAEELQIGTVEEEPEEATVQVHTLRAEAVPPRSRGFPVGALLGVLLLGGAGLLFFLLWRGKGGDRDGLAAHLTPPPESLLQTGYTAASPEALDVWETAGAALELDRVAAAGPGRFAFRLGGEAPPAGEWVLYREQLPVEPGRTYRARAFVRGPRGELRASLGLRFLTAGGAVAAEAFAPAGSGAGWTPVEVTAPAPPGVVRVALGWFARGGKGSFLFDRVTLVPGDLAPQRPEWTAGPFRVLAAASGTWSLRREERWLLLRVEYGAPLAGTLTRAGPFLGPETSRLRVAPKRLEFEAQGTWPGGGKGTVRWSLAGEGPLTFTLSGWGKGVRREALLFTVPAETARQGLLLVGEEQVVRAGEGPLTLADCRRVVIGGVRGVRLLFPEAHEVDYRPGAAGGEVVVWRAGREEPWRVTVELSLVEVLARARSALSRAREALHGGRYGEALRQLAQVVGPLVVEPALVQEARELFKKVRERSQADLVRLERKAERALFFRDPEELQAVLTEAQRMAQAYAQTPIAAPVEKRIQALAAALAEEKARRSRELAERYLAAARDLRDRGDVKLAEAYYREVMERCTGTPWAQTAKKELAAMQKVVAEVGAGEDRS